MKKKSPSWKFHILLTFIVFSIAQFIVHGDNQVESREEQEDCSLTGTCLTEGITIEESANGQIVHHHHHHHHHHYGLNIDSVPPFLTDFYMWLHDAWLTIRSKLSLIPGARIVGTYIRNSYQNDPARSVLEFILFLFALNYVFTKSRGSRRDGPVNLLEKLDKKEAEALIADWNPEPLVPPYGVPSERNDAAQTTLVTTEAMRNTTAVPPTGYWYFHLSPTPIESFAFAELDHLNASKQIVLQHTFNGKSIPPNKCKPQHLNKVVLNCANYDFLGISADPTLRDLANRVVRKYGVGTCGPRGFYGTVDLHLSCEQQIADFLHTDQSLLISQSFSSVTSVVPSFAKRGDLIVADDGISFPLKQGIQISRSNVIWFRHNDMNDLERVLLHIRERDVLEKSRKPSKWKQLFNPIGKFLYKLLMFPFGGPRTMPADSKATHIPKETGVHEFKIPGGYRPPSLQRRFIVTEGLFANTADVSRLDKLIELKEQYKHRLILDDSLGFGVLGHHGRGTPEHFGIPTKKVDIYLGSLAHALGGGGAFVAASNTVIEHLRLSGASYVYSAALPPVLAVVSMEVMSRLAKNPNQYIQPLRSLTRCFRMALTKSAVAREMGTSMPSIPSVVVAGDESSPMILIQIPKGSPIALKLAVEKEKMARRVASKTGDDGIGETRTSVNSSVGKKETKEYVSDDSDAQEMNNEPSRGTKGTLSTDTTTSPTSPTSETSSKSGFGVFSTRSSSTKKSNFSSPISNALSPVSSDEDAAKPQPEVNAAILAVVEETLLQAIVDECLNARSPDATLFTRAKFIYDQEGTYPSPSIRVCLSLRLSKRDVMKAAATLQSAVSKVMSDKC